MSSGTPPAMVSTAAPTITCGSILRYLSRSGSSTHDASGWPSWIGTAVPPLPPITAGELPGMWGRRKQGGRGSDVGRDDVRRAQIGLGQEPGQELAHRAGGQEDPPALRGAETRQVNREQAGVLGKRRPFLR